MSKYQEQIAPVLCECCKEVYTTTRYYPRVAKEIRHLVGPGSDYCSSCYHAIFNGEN